mmetsp:Transcript_18689/g.39738  ORF Transcript_18689/g.39738 Transcript_18689/m.39738 type:complete len:149 (-) Transcript_18689:40-486(-)
MAQEDSFVKEMRSLFESADEDDDGCLTVEELQFHLNDLRVRRRLKGLGIDVHQAAGLFKLLDQEDRGAVNMDEFAMGCLQLRGSAKSVDIATLMFENKKLMRSFGQHMDTLEETCSQILVALVQTAGIDNDQGTPSEVLPLTKAQSLT